MKYVLVNNEGRATAFYDTAVHATIPQGAVEITDEQWQDYLSNQNMKRFVNGQVVTRQKNIEELKAEKLAYIEQKCLAKAEGGLTWNGKTVPTDKAAMALLLGAERYLTKFPERTIKRAGLGVLTKDIVAALIDQMEDQQKAAFDVEADLYDEIVDAETIEELEAIDLDSGW
jgi:hypothetical protein